jgi:hypothetical protein
VTDTTPPFFDTASVFALIGERYLDTRHDAEYIEKLEEALALRGIIGVKRLAYEYVAAPALWWNVSWWDWVSLDGADVEIGWTYNLGLFGAVAALVGVVFGSVPALGTAISLHLLTLLVCLGLRTGTRRKAGE